MKRRTFLAAVAPLLAVTAPGSSQAQGPLGTSVTDSELGSLGAGGVGKARPATAPAAAPEAAADAKKAKGPTEITSREAMLDNRIHLATFSGEVLVKDPEFELTCDKLTVHLKKPKSKGGGAAKPAQPKPIGAGDDEPAKPAGEEKGGDGDSGIEKAIAEGNVVIIQDKLDAAGKKQRYYGKARKAIFDQDKKTCILYGWPKVSQSLDENMGKEIIATQESTIITLDQAGVIKADGPNKVRLSNAQALQQQPNGAR